MTTTRHLLAIDGHTVAADAHLLPGNDRPPVVFLHGIMTSLDLAPDLFVDASSESWIGLSLPGHHPGRLPPGCTVKDCGEDAFAGLAEGALRQLIGDRPVVVAGWSTGGFAALNLAIRHPRRVAAVASLAGFASGRRITGIMRWLVWMAGRPLGRHLTTSGLRIAAMHPAIHAFMVKSLAAHGKAAASIPHTLLAPMQVEYARHDPRSLAIVLAALWSLDITSRLGEIGVPAWIAGGAADPVVPRAETELIARSIPGSTLRLYDGAGHLFFSEWPRHCEDFAAWRREL